MDEITVENNRTSMYLCSNKLGDHGNDLESCGRNLLEFLNKKKQFIRFSKYPGYKICPTPRDGKEFLVDNQSMIGGNP